jgi:hypothetical protein
MYYGSFSIPVSNAALFAVFAVNSAAYALA